MAGLVNSYRFSVPSLLSDIKTNMFAWYTFDETGIATRNDSHGANHLNGTSGTPTHAAGLHGNALDTNDAGFKTRSSGDSGAFNFGDTAFSIAGWTFVDSYFTNRGIFSKWNGNGWAFFHKNGSPVTGFRFQVQGTSAETAAGFLTSTWYYLHGWHDPIANQIGIQINGGTKITTSYSGGMAAANIAVMAGGYNAVGNQFDGRLDEWGFWKRLLTDDEIAGLYNGGAGVSYADLP